jgi:hypothetical protein
MARSKQIIALFLAATITATLSAAPTFPFHRITDNSSANEGIGEAQFSFSLTEVSETQVRFMFYNSGPAASSITRIYFDDGTPGCLSMIQSIDNSSPGVSFAVGATPHNLPAGKTIDFQTAPVLILDSNSPVQPNGINPGEYLGVNMLATSYNDVLRSLVDGSLRVGLHVQGFANGSSESYVNGVSVVPLPASVALVFVGTGLVTVLRRRTRLLK